MQFKWLNESRIKNKDNNSIEIYAPAKSDFFCGGDITIQEGALPNNICNAPYYYTEMVGDFIMRVKVSLDFKSTYDASAVMVMKDIENWGKFCFEQTDFDTHAVVSVVTRNNISDDANGCNIQTDNVWLQVCRNGNAFAFHYSVDGVNYYMSRFFYLNADNVVKVGLVAQSPIGDGGKRIFEELSIQYKTVKNIRVGK